MTDEPMTDERLAEIRKYLDYPSVQFDEAMLMLNRLVPPLLADVDRLRARESLLREILDAASAVDGAAMRGMVNHARALLAQE